MRLDAAKPVTAVIDHDAQPLMTSCLRVGIFASAPCSTRQRAQPPNYFRCSPSKRSQFARHLRAHGVQTRQPSSAGPVQGSTISAAKQFQALEVLSLASSVGLQAYAVLQMRQARQQSHQSQEYEFYQSEVPSNYPTQTAAQPTWASHTAICALTLAFVFSKLGRWIMHGR